MDLVIDERDSNVSSSKSGDDDDQDDDQSSPQPPSGFPPQPPTSSSRSSSYNQHSPDGSTTPFTNKQFPPSSRVDWVLLVWAGAIFRLGWTVISKRNKKSIFDLI